MSMTRVDEELHSMSMTAADEDLRDMFAGLAMQAIIAAPKNSGSFTDITAAIIYGAVSKDIVKAAYKMSDAMLEERAK